jgi:hypothetical protein
MERRSVYAHDVNRAVSALQSYGKEKERIEAPRPSVPRGVSQPSQQENNESPEPEQTNNESVAQNEVEIEQAPPDTPAWAKKAYRKIVQITHPDKVNIDPEISDAQRDRLCSLYIEAIDAFKQAKWPELLEVAAELDIEVDADPKMMEEALESKIKDLVDTISKVKGTIAWAWGNSFGDLQKKVNILVRCCQVMGMQSPPVAALEEIVRELESSLEFDIVDRLGHVRRLKIEATKRRIGTRPEKKIR